MPNWDVLRERRTLSQLVCVCVSCALVHGELHVEMCWSMTVECGRASGTMVSMVCMLALNMALVIGIVAFGIFLYIFHLTIYV